VPDIPPVFGGGDYHGIEAFYHITFLAVAKTAGRNYEWKGIKVK